MSTHSAVKTIMARAVRKPPSTLAQYEWVLRQQGKRNFNAAISEIEMLAVVGSFVAGMAYGATEIVNPNTIGEAQERLNDLVGQMQPADK